MQINGQPVEFTFALILMNMIPVIIVAILVALGLEIHPGKNDQRLPDLRQIPRCIDHPRSCRCGEWKFPLGWELIPGLDPIFMAPAINPGEVMRAIEVIGSISCVLLGRIQWCCC